MANTKLKIDKILFFAILILSIGGFWYFEELISLRVLILLLAIVGVALGKYQKKSSYPSSRYELLALLTLFLGTLTSYNLLYNIGLPLYSVMLVTIVLISGLFYSLVSIDKLESLFGKDETRFFTALIGLISLELFLSLYFFPISPEIKSLIIVTVFYLCLNLVYLHTNNMLRLKRMAGFIVITLLILGTILLITWLKMPR